MDIRVDNTILDTPLREILARAGSLVLSAGDPPDYGAAVSSMMGAVAVEAQVPGNPVDTASGRGIELRSAGWIRIVRKGTPGRLLMVDDAGARILCSAPVENIPHLNVGDRVRLSPWKIEAGAE